MKYFQAFNWFLEKNICHNNFLSYFRASMKQITKHTQFYFSYYFKNSTGVFC